MAQRKEQRRPIGSCCIVEEGRGLAIRWWEKVIGKDGPPKWVKRYEALGPVSKKKAGEVLSEKLRDSRQGPAVEPTAVTFHEHAARWRRDILPTYKHSVQIGHGNILRLHLEPKFGNRPVAEITIVVISATGRLPRQPQWRTRNG